MNRTRESTAGAMPAAILRGASTLVPRVRRAEWLAEWQAELWYVVRANAGGSARVRSQREAVRFAMGAVRDAAWLRRDSLWQRICQRRWLRSPVNCMLVLVGLAALTAWPWFRAGGFQSALIAGGSDRGAIVGYFWSLVLAMIALPANRSLLFAEYPLAAGGLAQIGVWRRWSFLGAKFALIVAIVFFASLDLMNLIGLASAHSQGAVDAAQGCVLGPLTALVCAAAFRWALRDQRQRCPLCLLRLCDPARIGLNGQTIVDSRGTDYFCARGHGLMRVPDVTTSYNSPRWLDLESS